MNLRDKESLVGESRERSNYRYALSGACAVLHRGGPLDRLLDDKDVSAVSVVNDLKKLLAYENSVFRSYIDPERAHLEGLLVYAEKQVEREKAAKMADKCVAQIIKAGIGYSAAQSLFVKALDRKGEHFALEGW